MNLKRRRMRMRIVMSEGGLKEVKGESRKAKSCNPLLIARYGLSRLFGKAITKQDNQGPDK
jgi:hypothetical protein